MWALLSELVMQMTAHMMYAGPMAFKMAQLLIVKTIVGNTHAIGLIGTLHTARHHIVQRLYK